MHICWEFYIITIFLFIDLSHRKIIEQNIRNHYLAWWEVHQKTRVFWLWVEKWGWFDGYDWTWIKSNDFCVFGKIFQQVWGHEEIDLNEKIDLKTGVLSIDIFWHKWNGADMPSKFVLYHCYSCCYINWVNIIPKYEGQVIFWIDGFNKCILVPSHFCQIFWRKFFEILYRLNSNTV